ncbi:MAG TPA: PKD domain-containing protein [Flavitalea sp.]|nr:PKD domain-containing protein [Flavitalea sp.]
MKKVLVIFSLLCGSLSLYAAHIKGGEMFYQYLGPGAAGNSRYQVSLKLYIDCDANSPGQLDPSVPFTIFSRSNNQQIAPPTTAPMVSEEFIRFDPASNPCIANAPLDVCYRIRVYSAVIELTNAPEGYTIAFQRCCRIDKIVNLVSPSNAVGVTYKCEIPGTNFTVTPEAYKNSSPRFTTNDAVAVCSGSPFTISYEAEEPDGIDSISYQFCSGYRGASQGNPSPIASTPPPYSDLNYQAPFFGNAPFGPQVTINSFTGLVSGTAPAFITDPSARNQYVITVCAYEYRQGVLINIHRKDIHVKVSDCIPLRAQLKPDYSYCDDFNVTFRNEQQNPPGSIYIWQYGDNTKSDTSNDILGTVQHQYTDTGSYKVKVKVILAGQCIDSTITIARVYPGFYPGFTSTGSCKLLPFQFNDTTRSRYGTAASWKWNFGDETSQADTSSQKNPTWLYSTSGFKRVQLIVQSNKGCVDTAFVNVEVRDKPLITMPFRDTLICSIDTLQLHAIGNGNFSWGPPGRIFNANTPDPFVYPQTTTTYRVTLNESGCINTDSVRVRVVDFVTLNAAPDSTICQSDPVQLVASGDGLQFTWTPAASLNDSRIKSPVATPLGTTVYSVTARIGKCATTDNITIRTIPYPVANAGADTTVCFEDTATLRASITGSRFLWNPTSTLSNGTILNPNAFPRTTTAYTLTVFDTLGCPKPMNDIVNVTVRSKIKAFSGNDTNVVVGQPLQLRGFGAELFLWVPSTGLNRNDIANPVAVLQSNVTYVMRAYTVEGCFAYDTMSVRVFKTRPDIFVPTAFAPNGKNRIFRPIPVGISEFDYFRVYNRWGQLVFSSKEANRGWDGTVGGKPQDTGSYAWMVRGKDFTGKVVEKKGTVVLIR